MALVLLLLVSAFAYGAAWQIEVVDPAGGGRFSDTAIDSTGNIHVAYVNPVDHQLKYAFWDHRLRKWFRMIVDNQCSGFASLALDSARRPHIAYLDWGASRLKYAYWDGGAWHIQPINLSGKGIEYYTSITLDANNQPIISYYETVGPDREAGWVLRMREVRYTGTQWQTRTVDSTLGSGKFNSIASLMGNDLQLAYANVRSETAGLRYARWNGSFWDVQVLEGLNGPQGIYSVKMVLDAQARPHIAYTDTENRYVKYATLRDGRWQLQVVDRLAAVAYPDRNGLALDAAGAPFISYYDSNLGLLKLAHVENGRWISEVVDGNFAGLTSSIQIANGEIAITYYDTVSNSLKVARRPLQEKNGAGPTTSDTTGTEQNHRVAVASAPEKQ